MVEPVNDLSEASKSIATLQALLDRDMASNCVRNAGSHSRNLLRVKRELDMVWVLFEQILIAEGNSLKDPASKAYAQVFAPHHGWAIRKAVAARIIERTNKKARVLWNSMVLSLLWSLWMERNGIIF
ncbi:accelerated cell death 11-like [Morus notabilis]|uniref:accelerated cell death 11-like n=1 Tax=Morus notabilis TaxID=981085 RepID=UPI000CED1D82|nr:accelerated cell death 11-like [Morus notabilis]